MRSEGVLRLDVKGSASIKAFEYRKQEQVLRVEFTRGGHYDYVGLPESVVRKWMEKEAEANGTDCRDEGNDCENK